MTVDQAAEHILVAVLGIRTKPTLKDQINEALTNLREYLSMAAIAHDERHQVHAMVQVNAWTDELQRLVDLLEGENDGPLHLRSQQAVLRNPESSG